MKKTRLKNLITLTALAFLAGGIEQTHATPGDRWTLVGPSAGGGYIIVGSGTLNLGNLGPSTFPVHLSANGGDIITLDAGSYVNSASGEVISIATGNNTLNNYGSIIGTNDGAVYAAGNNNTFNNWGKVNGLDYGFDIEGNHNVLNNWGTITSPNYGAVYFDHSYNVVNNWGTISAGDYAFLDYGTYNTVNNWALITSPYLGIYEDASHDTINNWATVYGSSYAIYNDGNHLTVNNHGVMASSYYGYYNDQGNNNVINNWGSIGGTADGGVYFNYTDDAMYNTVNNWGSITSAQGTGVFLNTNDALNNWGSIGGGVYGVELYDPANRVTNYPGGTISGKTDAIYIDDLHETVTNWGRLSTPSTGSGVIFDNDDAFNVITNHGDINGNGGPGIILFDSDHETLNLDGHSSVIGKIQISAGANNVVNLNFTGLSPATIAALNAQLAAQGVNSGNPTSAVFTVRGVNYNIDPAIINSNLKSYQAQAKDPSAAAIGANLDSLTKNPAAGTPFFNLLNAIDNSGNASGALDAISPIKYAIYGDLAIQNTTALVQGIDRRLNNLGDGSESVDTTSLGGDNTVAAVVTGDPGKDGSKESKQVVQPEPQQNRWGFFASGDGLFFRGNGGSSMQDGKSNSAGTIAGVDGKVGDHAVIGALFAYNNSAVDLGNDGSHATIESYTGGIYGSYHQDGFYANSLAAYTRNNYSSSSNILFPGFATTGNGSTHGNQYSANIDGGYDFNLGSRLTVGPIAGLQYVHLDVNGFNEAGGTLALGDQSVDSLQSRLGAKAQYKIANTATSSTGFEVYAAWQHEYLDNSRAMTASFQGSGLAPFAVQTGSPERDAAVVGASLNFTFKKRLTLFADYELQMWNQSNFEQTINGGAKISW